MGTKADDYGVISNSDVVGQFVRIGHDLEAYPEEYVLQFMQLPMGSHEQLNEANRLSELTMSRIDQTIQGNAFA